MTGIASCWPILLVSLLNSTDIRPNSKSNE